jgi:hypothetical protein
LATIPDTLYQPGDVAGLMSAIRGQLQQPVWPTSLDAPSWHELGMQVAAFLEDVVTSAKSTNSSSHSKGGSDWP